MRSKLVVSLMLVGCAGSLPQPPAVDLGTPLAAAPPAATGPAVTFNYTADRVGDVCREASKVQTTTTAGSTPPKLYEREQADTYEVLAVANDVSVKERFAWSRHSIRRSGVEDVIPISLGTQYLMSLDEQGARQAFDAQGGPLPKPLAEWITGHWRVGVRDDIATALHGNTLRPGDEVPALAARYRKQIVDGATLRSERYLYIGQEGDNARFSIEVEADFRWESPGTFSMRTKLWVSVPRGTPSREETSFTVVRQRREGDQLHIESSGFSEDSCEAR